MTPAEAVERMQFQLGHLWMIRTFLKHADEVIEDEQLIQVPRLLYDSIRATEPAYQVGDHDKYLRRIRGKLGKLRKIAEMFAAEYRRVSVHTNFEMASLSLTGAVRTMEAILSQVVWQSAANPSSAATTSSPSPSPSAREGNADTDDPDDDDADDSPSASDTSP